MAHYTLDSVHPDDALEPREQGSLGWEKLGVIAGFLVGLPLGVSLVAPNLSDLQAPGWLTTAATVAVVATCTWLGWRLASRQD